MQRAYKSIFNELLPHGKTITTLPDDLHQQSDLKMIHDFKPIC